MGVEYSKPLSSSLGRRSPSAQIKGSRHHTAQQRELGFIQSIQPHPELKIGVRLIRPRVSPSAAGSLSPSIWGSCCAVLGTMDEFAS